MEHKHFHTITCVFIAPVRPDTCSAYITQLHKYEIVRNSRKKKQKKTVIHAEHECSGGWPTKGVTLLFTIQTVTVPKLKSWQAYYNFIVSM